jgi:hypothetical protein
LGSTFLFRSTEVGLDIMVNEHHSTSTCLTIAVPMALALAREMKRLRRLCHGNSTEHASRAKTRRASCRCDA